MVAGETTVCHWGDVCGGVCVGCSGSDAPSAGGRFSIYVYGMAESSSTLGQETQPPISNKS